MMSSPATQRVAQAFLRARATAAPLGAYPGEPPATLAAAYAIQDAALALDGRAVGGWKVGRIAADMAGRHGADRLAGPIFADEICDGAGAPDMPVYVGGFAAAEAEIVLRFGDVGTRDYNVDTVRACITEVRAGIEIASSPFAGINRHGPAVTVSDYGNNKGLVLGPAIAEWQNADLIRLPVEMQIDGRRVGAATMETMLDGPFGSALFLIDMLRTRGIAIPPGTWVSAGAITGVHEIAPGQHAEARFGADVRVACSIRRA